MFKKNLNVLAFPDQKFEHHLMLVLNHKAFDA